jgi:hypothetical protein
LHQNLTAVATLTGKLQRSPLFALQQNNFLAHPDTTRTIAAIVGAVSHYPDAARAVTAALRRLESESSLR